MAEVKNARFESVPIALERARTDEVKRSSDEGIMSKEVPRCAIFCPSRTRRSAVAAYETRTMADAGNVGELFRPNSSRGFYLNGPLRK